MQRSFLKNCPDCDQLRKVNNGAADRIKEQIVEK